MDKTTMAALEALLADDRHMAGKPFLNGYEQWLENGTALFDPELLAVQSGIPTDPVVAGIAMFRLREVFIDRFGFAVATPDLIAALVSLGPVLEIGAGKGALSRLLANAGANVIATDLQPQGDEHSWIDVQKSEATAAIRQTAGRNVICSWPSLNGTWITRAARAMEPGRILIVIGEGRGGCTGSDCFFDLQGKILEPCSEVLGGADVWRFPAIHDTASAWRRL